MQTSSACAAVVAALLLVTLVGAGHFPVAESAPSPCDPAHLELAPSSVRDLCAVVYKLSQNYADERVDSDISDVKRLSPERHRPEHVFLRFGRRR